MKNGIKQPGKIILFKIMHKYYFCGKKEKHIYTLSVCDKQITTIILKFKVLQRFPYRFFWLIRLEFKIKLYYVNNIMSLFILTICQNTNIY